MDTAKIFLLCVIAGGFGLYLFIKGFIYLRRRRLKSGLAYLLVGIPLSLVLTLPVLSIMSQVRQFRGYRWEMKYDSGQVKSGKVHAKNLNEAAFPQPDNIDLTFSGIYRTWYKNGQLHKVAGWKNGQRHGKLQFWHPNGQLSDDFELLEGKSAGVWKCYDEKGVQFVNVPYEDGERHGILTTWWTSTGKKAVESHWARDKKNGISKHWDETGNLIKEEIWESGELIETKESGGP